MTRYDKGDDGSVHCSHCDPRNSKRLPSSRISELLPWWNGNVMGTYNSTAWYILGISSKNASKATSLFLIFKLRSKFVLGDEGSSSWEVYLEIREDRFYKEINTEVKGCTPIPDLPHICETLSSTSPPTQSSPVKRLLPLFTLRPKTLQQSVRPPAHTQHHVPGCCILYVLSVSK